MTTTGSPRGRTVSMVTLGCARNEVDSEELAGRLAEAGWNVVGEGENADVVMVNTCGFIQAAKQESIDELLAASDSGAEVVAVGCLAERYGAELGAALPEAQVLSFDDYQRIGERLDDVLAGRRTAAHTPRDRRRLLPVSPVARPARAVNAPWIPGLAGARRRLSDSPAAPLKIASGCDRRCSFCAIPSFRGAFVSRPPDEIVAEARWLTGNGVRELFLVSENTTSYGKDLGDLRALEGLLPRLGELGARVRLSYLQPAELRPSLIKAMVITTSVAPYFDISFQHASGPVLRAMRRFGDRERFLALLDQIRELAPEAGIRSNFIVGFPGETAADLEELERFLGAARLDAIGIFGYSDEDGTAAEGLPGKNDAGEVSRRVEEFAALAEELMDQRAAERVGELAEVLVEREIPAGEPGDGELAGYPGGAGFEAGAGYEGRAAHQGPEVDGTVTLRVPAGAPRVPAGEMIAARITGSAGADLFAVPASR